ncbi:hypothetical protein ACP4OV_005914 [Aristida adscensionis]
MIGRSTPRLIAPMKLMRSISSNVWVEEYAKECPPEVLSLGYAQAMKIAAEFSHLPASLAIIGYNQEMSFTEALRDIHAKGLFPSRSAIIKAEIDGGPSFCLQYKYYLCMNRMPKQVPQNADVLKGTRMLGAPLRAHCRLCESLCWQRPLPLFKNRMRINYIAL